MRGSITAMGRRGRGTTRARDLRARLRCLRRDSLLNQASRERHLGQVADEGVDRRLEGGAMILPPRLGRRPALGGKVRSTPGLSRMPLGVTLEKVREEPVEHRHEPGLEVRCSPRTLHPRPPHRARGAQIAGRRRFPTRSRRREQFWRDRDEDLNAFERHLHRSGTRVVGGVLSPATERLDLHLPRRTGTGARRSTQPGGPRIAERTEVRRRAWPRTQVPLGRWKGISAITMPGWRASARRSRAPVRLCKSRCQR